MILQPSNAAGLLTAKEIADRIRVTPDTVRRWTRKGIIPVVRTNNEVIRYDDRAVVGALLHVLNTGAASRGDGSHPTGGTTT